jgi:membrane fusion protein (multidrug efflux system)
MKNISNLTSNFKTADFKSLHTHITNSKKTKTLLITIGTSILFLIGIFYWIHSNRYISTDDAYINANVIQIAARVNGQVLRVDVNNNQFVKQGTLLLELDAMPYIVALDKAKAQFAMAVATLNNAQVSTSRINILAKDKVISRQGKDDALKNLQVAVASFQAAKADLAQAQLNLRYTHIFAQSDGHIANLTLREGNNITAYQPLFALIGDTQYWVDANFKETDLQRIQQGQAVEVEVDMYPHHKFSGVVDSISGGSGTAFSLLPPENATGNWIKITQRVPVKILITNPDLRYPLRIGTTADITIDTKTYEHRK